MEDIIYSPLTSPGEGGGTGFEPSSITFYYIDRMVIINTGTLETLTLKVRPMLSQSLLKFPDLLTVKPTFLN